MGSNPTPSARCPSAIVRCTTDSMAKSGVGRTGEGSTVKRESDLADRGRWLPVAPGWSSWPLSVLRTGSVSRRLSRRSSPGRRHWSSRGRVLRPGRCPHILRKPDRGRGENVKAFHDGPPSGGPTAVATGGCRFLVEWSPRGNAAPTGRRQEVVRIAQLRLAGAPGLLKSGPAS